MLDKLSQQIAKSAQEEAEGIVSAAHDAAAEAIRKAKSEAARKVARSAEEAKEAVSMSRAERMAAAKLEAKKMLASAREDAAEAALRTVWSELKHTRGGREYQKLLLALADAALEELGDADGEVCANKEDAKWLAGYKNLSKKSIECEGGCIAMSGDGKVRVDMTLESIFEAGQDQMRKKIYKALFG